MITRKEIIDFLKANPGATNRDLAEHFRVTTALMSTKTRQYLAGGFVTRQEASRTLTNIPVYGYYVNTEVAPGMTKKERVETTLGQRLDNAQTPEIAGTIKTLAEALARQIAAQVVVSLQPMLQRELAAVVPVAPPIPVLDVSTLLPSPAAPVEKPKRMKVGVIGLLPQQAGLLTTEFGEHFEFRFWKGESNGLLKSIGVSCDVVLTTKWSAHSQTETLKSVGANVRHVAGGMDELRTTLTALYVEGVA